MLDKFVQNSRPFKRNIMKNKIVPHFYVKESWKDKKGEVPIYLRITVNGERAEISTNRKVNPELWDKTSQRVAGRSEPARVINSALNNILGKVEKYFGNLDVKDERISVQQIISELKGTGNNQITLVHAYEYHIRKLEELAGIDFAIATVKKYGYSLKNLKRFLKKLYDKTDIKLCDLSHKFIDSYYTYLRTTENLQHNSAAKSIQRCIFFIVILRWFSSTLKSQEPLKINSANSIHHILKDFGGWIFLNKVRGKDPVKIKLTLF
jgi:uncharacterized protein (DUF433 family)